MTDDEADTASLVQRFGDVVRQQREDSGISQEDLADRAGLHRTYISLIERGLRTSSITTVQRLAEALGVSMTDLIARTEKP